VFDYKGGARIQHAAALDLLPRSERRMTEAYQIWQRLSGGRTIASPFWKLRMTNLLQESIKQYTEKLCANSIPA